MGGPERAIDLRSRFRSRWGLNLAILVLGGLVALQLFGREVPVDSYRLDTDGRLVVTVPSGGSFRWNRIARIEASEADVTVTIRMAQAPVPMADIGIPAELVVPLEEPLGDREVIDGSRDRPVPRSP